MSPAAMAIADQIMGLDAKIASTGLPWLRGGTGATHTVEQELVIGRLESDGRLIVADGRVSRSHARVTAAYDRLVVEDLGSSNGTFLARGDELTRVGAEPVPLQAGDRIETVDRLLLAEVIEMEAS